MEESCWWQTCAKVENESKQPKKKGRKVKRKKADFLFCAKKKDGEDIRDRLEMNEKWMLCRKRSSSPEPKNTE